MADLRFSAAAPMARGFTLIEMVSTIMIVGVLAVVVVPRFANRSDFDSRGFFDGTLSILEYAQKAAVAQRRLVCVSFAGAAVTLTIASSFGSTCHMTLTGPNGVRPYSLAVPAGVSFVATPTDFDFSPAGVASAGQVISVTGLAGRIITVDPVTGYVYAN